MQANHEGDIDLLPVRPDQLRQMRRTLPGQASMHRLHAKERTVQMQRYKLELQHLYGEHFSHDMVDPGHIESELSYNDCILFIDPIDARKTFKAAPEDITTIIGLSVKGWPKAGVIHKPFHTATTGRTLIGTVESGCFMYDTSSNQHSIATYLPPNTIN